MSELIRQPVVDVIHSRYPVISPADFTLELIERLHGRELPQPSPHPTSQAMEAELLPTVVAALESAGIPHMVTGSIASAIHGQPRATRDIDFVIDPNDQAVEILVTSFPTDRFYVGDARSAVAQRDMFNIIDVTTGWKADLIIRKDRAFSREEFARRQAAAIAGIQELLCEWSLA